MITAKTLTLTDIARIGLYLDDPYCDGIRLDKVREPSDGRLAALAEVAGEPMLDGEELIRAEYEAAVRYVLRRGKLPATIERHMAERGL